MLCRARFGMLCGSSFIFLTYSIAVPVKKDAADTGASGVHSNYIFFFRFVHSFIIQQNQQPYYFFFPKSFPRIPLLPVSVLFFFDSLGLLSCLSILSLGLKSSPYLAL